MNKLTSFYLGSVDDHNRTLDYILNQDDEFWELCHNYIQWVFPTSEKSMYNLTVPILLDDDILYWRTNETIKTKLKESYDRYLLFLVNNQNIWVTKSDHNHLRISRVLKCLRLSGLDNLATQLYEFVSTKDEINYSTKEFWKEVMK